MHPLLIEASSEAKRLYDSVPDATLDWTKLRVSSLHKQFSNPEFLKILKRGTKVVSASEFKTAFATTVIKLQSVLQRKRWFAVLVTCKDDDEVFSRSLYFFLLALQVCPDLGRTLEGILRLPMKKQISLSDYFTQFRYVCFDDVVTSGCNIELSFKPVSNMPRIVVAPYVGEVSKELLNNDGIEVVHSEVIRQFVRIDPSRSNTVDFKYGAYPLVFSHRAFNSVESFPEVYDKLLERVQKPPYSPSTSYSRYDYLTGDILRKFVS